MCIYNSKKQILQEEGQPEFNVGLRSWQTSNNMGYEWEHMSFNICRFYLLFILFKEVKWSSNKNIPIWISRRLPKLNHVKNKAINLIRY